MSTVYKWLFLILLFAAPAYPQNVRVDNVAFSSVQGFPFLPGATITICTAAGTGLPCMPTVAGTCLSISDATCNQSATITSDAFGNYGFWIQPGSYTYTVTKAGFGGFGPRALTLAVPSAGTGPGTFTNLTVSGTGTFTGSNLSASAWQNCLQWDGTTYPFTNAGLQSLATAIVARPLGERCMTSGTTTTVSITSTVQFDGADDVYVDLSNVVLNVETAGIPALVFGNTSSGVRRSRYLLRGGYIRRTNGGALWPAPTDVGGVGIEFTNVSFGKAENFTVTGFETGFWCRGPSNVSSGVGACSYVEVRPLSMFDNKVGVQFMADASPANGQFVKDNWIIDGEITYTTSGALCQAGGTTGVTCNYSGGHNIRIDDNGNANSTSANTVLGTSLEMGLPGAVGTNRPEDFILLNSAQNVFTNLYTECAAPSCKNTWFVDNSGVSFSRNQFLGSRGGSPIVGITSMRTQSGAQFFTDINERTNFIGGGNGCNTAYQVACPALTAPLLILQEVNQNGDQVFVLQDTGGVERYLIDATGNVVQNGNLTLNSNGSKIAIAEGTAPSNFGGIDACYGDSTAHALKCSYNNGTFFQIPQVITATSAAFATATTAGTCVQSTTAVTNAATSMAVSVSPVSTPGVGAVWSAFVSSAGNVTINECAVAASAGGTIAFNIRVTP